MMRRTIKYAVLIFICVLTYISKAQFTIAGNNGSIYVDIIPDTLLNPPSSNSTFTETYYIDMNQDGTKEVELKCRTQNSPGGSSNYTSVISQDTTIKFSFFRIDSTQYGSGCGGPGWMTTGTMLKSYILGDTITSGKYVSGGYLCQSGSSMNCYSYSDGLWIQNYDQYVGVRYNNSGTYIYGWIRVNVSWLARMLVKDFSLGNYVVGMQKERALNYSVFPNPAQNSIIIKTKLEQQSVALINSLGEILYEQPKSMKNSEIDIRNFPEGIYFVQVKTTEGTITKKIIVQR